MAFDENALTEQVNSLKIQLATAKAQFEPVLERYTNFKMNLGIKEKRDGALQIDFAKMVERLGPEQCAVLRQVIDEKHGAIAGLPPEAPMPLAALEGKTVQVISAGGEGQKPRLRIVASA